MTPEFQILLRDKREKSETQGAVTFTTLSSEEMHVSEVYLRGDRSSSFSPGTYLLLPVHGDLAFKEKGSEKDLFPSQFSVFSAEKEFSIYGSEELSRFYLFRFKSNTKNLSGEYSTELRNSLQQLFSDENYSLHIGIFDGRKETGYTMTRPNALVICVNGAFEFQNRLIETCDSLLIKNDSLLEMEALSENAILIILGF